MPKVLITGASGFVGSFLVEEALKRAYSTYAGVRKSSSLAYLKQADIQFFYTELSDTVSITSQLIEHGPFDYIIHNAGLTKTCDKRMFDKVNYEYTQNLVESIKESQMLPKKFIFISSLAAQGPGKKGTAEPVRISDTPRPQSLYGHSKLKAEQYIKQAGLDYLIIRPTGVYGPREQDYLEVFKSINMGIETFVGSTHQYISFIYVKDLARLIFDAIEAKHINQTYFVSDLQIHTSKSFNQLIKEVLRKKTRRIVFPKSMVKAVAFLNEKWSCAFHKVPTLNTEKYKDIICDNWLCDSQAIVDDFNFKPEYDLKKGVQESIAWYKEQKWI